MESTKRQKTDQINSNTKNQGDDGSDSDGTDPIEVQYVKTETGELQRRVNMPKKNRHRMRAHINPMNELTIEVPKNPKFA